MSAPLSWSARTVLPLAVAATVGVSMAPAVAAGHTASAPTVRAVVVVNPGVHLPLAVPGAKVLSVFGHVGAEVVRAPLSALSSLARDPRVAGMTPDRTGHVAGTDATSSDASVLVAQSLGGAAGRKGTGAGVNVALLDTGVTDTSALARSSGRITDGVDVSRLSAGGAARTSGTFTDGFGHGTFLASLIAGGKVAGSGDRAIGVAPDARIVVVKVADDKGKTSLSQVLAGMDWVAAHARAIQVVNLALAVDRPTAPAYGADPLTAAVEHVRAAGVVVVAAAGNKANQVGDPGLSPQALTVGAADLTGKRPAVAPFSGSGVVAGVTKPDVVAAGVHVLGVINANSVIARENPKGWQKHGLFRGSGTSEATAVTSGVVAAYVSDHVGASVLQVKSAVRRSAVALHTRGAGAGLLSMVGGDGGAASAAAAGEAGFDQRSWNAHAWTGVKNWQSLLAKMWSGPAWDATTWSATTWSATSWSATSWSATSWSATSWSRATTWSATSWSATSWSATSWSAYGWGGS